MIDLRLGDCLELMKAIPDGSVDMVFADPPFNVGKKYGGNGNGDRRADYYEWCGAWISECFRVLKDTDTVYLMTIPKHLARLYPMLDKQGVFINHVNWRNVSAARAPRQFWSTTQPILVYGKTGEYKFNQYAQVRDVSKLRLRWGGYTTEPKGQLLDYWDDIPFVYAGSVHHPEAILKSRTNEKEHPCQMPIALPERAIVFSTDEGDVVLDPFLGVGATALACLKHRRDCIGIDMEPHYLDITHKRIEEAQMQLALPMGIA